MPQPLLVHVELPSFCDLCEVWQGGNQIGFDAQTASKIITQTVKGASELLIQRQQHPECEIDKVTTPNGCTIVGLNEMEHNGFSSALIKGITASRKKIDA